MEKISNARKICATILSEFYTGVELLADALGNDGGYRGFWLTPSGMVLETKSDNVFDRQAMTYIYELKYKRPLGWPMAS